MAASFYIQNADAGVIDEVKKITGISDLKARNLVIKIFATSIIKIYL